MELARGRLERAADEAARGLEVIGRFRATHPEDARALNIQGGLLVTVARIREEQARGAAAPEQRAHLAEACGLYEKVRAMYEGVPMPMAANLANATARDAERCRIALAAVSER